MGGDPRFDARRRPKLPLRRRPVRGRRVLKAAGEPPIGSSRPRRPWESPEMPFRPDEIADKEFLVGLRGYDKDEVRTFLRQVAEQVAAAEAAPPPPAPAAAPAPAPATEWANLGDE